MLQLSNAAGRAFVGGDASNVDVAATSNGAESGVADADAYRSLLTKVYALASGNLDQSTFEDECRRLLGINGFVVFTIDKLLQAATRHLQTLLSDDVASRLLALHQVSVLSLSLDMSTAH